MNVMRKKILLFVLLLVGVIVYWAISFNPSKEITALNFESENRNPAFQFLFPKPTEDSILRQLRQNYPIEALVKNAKSEREKVLLALNWVRQQWEHSTSHNAKTDNACLILERAKKGEQFRCVEYGVVLKSVLAALGLPSRTLSLKTRDVSTTFVAAGHVLAEVWLNDYQKWAFVDAQFDAMPVLDSVPLNAVELQNAIIQKKPFKFIHLQGDFTVQETANYMGFIPHYLYYMSVAFDERNVKSGDKFKVANKTALMLVPLGAKNPNIFQLFFPMNNLLYTHSLADFYAKPLQ